MTDIVNLTPHAIVIDNGTTVTTIEPSGTIARISSQVVNTGKEVGGIAIFTQAIGEVKDLPEPKEDTIFIVSGMVLANIDREDVFAPNTAMANRNEKGHIVSVPGLIK